MREKDHGRLDYGGLLPNAHKENRGASGEKNKKDVPVAPLSVETSTDKKTTAEATKVAHEEHLGQMWREGGSSYD